MSQRARPITTGTTGMLVVPSTLDARITGVASWYVWSNGVVRATLTDGRRYVLPTGTNPSRLTAHAIAEILSEEIR